MHLDHVFVEIEAAVDDQLRIASPELAEIAAPLMSALRPALERTLLRVVEGVANEVGAQLTGQRVEVRLVDGEPRLAVVDDPVEETERDEDLEARVTLRLPPSLKTLIEESASGAGESINAWVVETLRNRAGRSRPGRHIEETFDL